MALPCPAGHPPTHPQRWRFDIGVYDLKPCAAARFVSICISCSICCHMCHSQEPPPIDWAAWKKQLDPELVSAFEKAYTSAPISLCEVMLGKVPSGYVSAASGAD